MNRVNALGRHSMLYGYQTLKFKSLKRETKLYQPFSMRTASIDFDEPAIMVMTDFKHTMPFSIEPTVAIEVANEKMKNCGVRLLFVSDVDNNVLGLVTAEDILGEKPVLYIQDHGGQRGEIIVLDVMTKWEDIDVVTLDEVSDATVGDVIETMQQATKHHILVVDRIYGKQVVRGLFSKTQVGRQVGEEINFNERANNFLELEMALSPI